MTWYDLKELIGEYTGLERDALHIHAALFLYLIAMGLFRRNRRSRVPWLIVLAAELANEGYDAWHNWGEDPNWILQGTIKDLWNTMLWPTVLLLVGRYTNWFQRRPPPAAATEPDLQSRPDEAIFTSARPEPVEGPPFTSAPGTGGSAV